MAKQYLSYSQVADRIEAALGVRPAPSTLRAAAADNSRGGTRIRVTAGMPAPVPPHPGGNDPPRFDATAIDRWLADHPRLKRSRSRQRLVAAPAGRREQAVARAVREGLSWQVIAGALGEADGASYSRQGVHARYRRSQA